MIASFATIMPMRPAERHTLAVDGLLRCSSFAAISATRKIAAANASRLDRPICIGTFVRHAHPWALDARLLTINPNRDLRSGKASSCRVSQIPGPIRLTLTPRTVVHPPRGVAPGVSGWGRAVLFLADAGARGGQAEAGGLMSYGTDGTVTLIENLQAE